MKNRTTLAMMEQVIMILVFAVAAAFCVQAFLWADIRSEKNAERDMAVMCLESGAEVIKDCCGDADAAALIYGENDSGTWRVFYDESWTETGGEPSYILTAEMMPTDGLLGRADITVEKSGGEKLCSITVAWQEVGRDG